MRDANFMLSDADRRATNFQFEIGEDGGGVVVVVVVVVLVVLVVVVVVVTRSY